MSIETILNSLLVSDTYSLSVFDILGSTLVPFLLSFVVTFTYQRTQKNMNYSVGFIHSIFLFSGLTSIVTMIIGSNIARAFGLIGALSVIRFRNALKSPIDAVYIFWALVIGMACGVGFYLAAALLTIVSALFMLLLDWVGYGQTTYTDSIFRVSIHSDQEAAVVPEIEAKLKAQSRAVKRINVLFDSKENVKTYVYLVKTSRGLGSRKIEQHLQTIRGVFRIHHLRSEPGVILQ